MWYDEAFKKKGSHLVSINVNFLCFTNLHVIIISPRMHWRNSKTNLSFPLLIISQFIFQDCCEQNVCILLLANSSEMFAPSLLPKKLKPINYPIIVLYNWINYSIYKQRYLVTTNAMFLGSNCSSSNDATRSKSTGYFTTSAPVHNSNPCKFDLTLISSLAMKSYSFPNEPPCLACLTIHFESSFFRIHRGMASASTNHILLINWFASWLFVHHRCREAITFSRVSLQNQA